MVAEPYEHADAEEELAVGGFANNVLNAHGEAWRRLEAVLSFDPHKAWALKEIKHVYVPEDLEADPPQQEGVAFAATFVRDDTPTPRSAEEAEYLAGELDDVVVPDDPGDVEVTA